MKIYASQDYVNEAIEKHSSFNSGHLTFKNIEGRLPEAFNSTSVPSSCVVDGKCVLVRNGCDYCAHSDDGYNYSIHRVPNAYWSGIVYGNGRFVANTNLIYNGASGPSIVVYSDDGYNWKESSIPSTCDDFVEITYFNNMFIAALNNIDGAKLYVSEDGVVWSQRGYPSRINSFAVGNGVCVGVGDASVNFDYSLSQKYLCIDRNFNMHYVEPPYEVSRSGLHKVVFGNGIFIETWSGDRFSYSIDGMSWTEFTLPFTIDISTLTFCGEKFIATSGTNIVVSEDGLNWDVYENCVPSGVLKEITYFNDQYIAFTNSLDIYYSKDAKIWTSQEKFLKQGDIDVTESFKEYINISAIESDVSEALAALTQKSQVQIVIWEADD